MKASYTQTEIDMQRVLGADGPIASAYSGYELRPGQIEMAAAVQQSLKSSGRLIVEAGTGLGKSFAYLVPAIEAVKAKNCKILVSTYTITLQEQLINKDLPFLARTLQIPFKAALAKGRGNFLCLRRLEYAVRKQQGLFDSDTAVVISLNNWAKQTSDGSLSEVDFAVPAQVWSSLRSEHGNCRGRKCPNFNKCFYWKNRRRLETADIIVANHALLFSDLTLKLKRASVLPDYEYVIIDEAHNLEHVAEGHFGLNISSRRVNFILNGLYNPSTKKGFLTGDEGLLKMTKAARRAAADFFDSVENWLSTNHGNGRVAAGFVPDTITESLKTLRLGLGRRSKNSSDEDEKFEFERFSDLLAAIEKDTGDFLTQSADECVYWVEAAQDRRKSVSLISAPNRRKSVSLISAPINPAADIKKYLFDEFESVVLTSATLCCEGRDSKSGFDFYARRIGLENFQTLKLGSPFDYQNQVTVYIESELAEPNSPDFVGSAAEKIKKYIEKTNGKAFVLFTSYKMLREMADILSGWFEQKRIQLLIQSGTLDRGGLLDTFRADTESVLFGTDSFWQGVDVPGEALSNVIIVRLPFAVPTHPLVQGRIEQIRSQGQNPFFEYQLPAAIIKFKQGVGRLIRNKNDKGIVSILDSRIVRKSYGRQFLNAVETSRIEIASEP